MNEYRCVDCEHLFINKLKIPPKRCLKCYRKWHKKEPPICRNCSNFLKHYNRTANICRICYIKSGSKKFKDIDKDTTFGNWLAGFVDGEGNFQGNSKTKVGYVFRIILREDDKEILEEIRQRLGVGKLYYRDIKKNMKNWQPKYQSDKLQNQWEYAVMSVYDLVTVVIPYFDKYKLRAKKKIQYKNWRDTLLPNYKSLKEVV